MSDAENAPNSPPAAATPTGATSPPPVKPESGDAPQNDDTLSIRVTDGTTEISFKVKTKTQLKRVMEAFCKRTGKDMNALRFMFDGERVSNEDTPTSLSMEDQDTIEALNQQTGGC